VSSSSFALEALLDWSRAGASPTAGHVLAFAPARAALLAALKTPPDARVGKALLQVAAQGLLHTSRVAPLARQDMELFFAQACQAHCAAPDIERMRLSLDLYPGCFFDIQLTLATARAAREQGLLPPKNGRLGRVLCPRPWSCLWPMSARAPAHSLGELCAALGAWSPEPPDDFFFALRRAWREASRQAGSARPQPIEASAIAAGQAFPALLANEQGDAAPFVFDVMLNESQERAQACSHAFLDAGLPPKALRAMALREPRAACLAAWADAWELAKSCAASPAAKASALRV
jgi:hypothetical protein